MCLSIYTKGFRASNYDEVLLDATPFGAIPTNTEIELLRLVVHLKLNTQNNNLF